MENAGGFWQRPRGGPQWFKRADIHEHNELNSGRCDVVCAAAQAGVGTIARLVRFVFVAPCGDLAKFWRDQIAREHFEADEQGETESQQTNELAPAIHSCF